MDDGEKRGVSAIFRKRTGSAKLSPRRLVVLLDSRGKFQEH